MSKTCCDNKLNLDEAKEILGLNKISRTQNKIDTIRILSNSTRPLSASEVHKKLKKNACDISTVFRTLKQFQEKGIITTVNLGEDFLRYEFVNQAKPEHHHHHILCKNCGNIQHIDVCDLKIFEKMISKLGFKEVEHFLEFKGICPECS
jgi:Fur family ferric uptake transcriptional regulator